MVLSNNPLVRERRTDTRYIEGSALDVLLAARGLVHLGHRLLSNPLAGSLKPGQTPYRSVLISDGAGAADHASIVRIERAVETTRRAPYVGTTHAEDLALIDFALIESGAG